MPLFVNWEQMMREQAEAEAEYATANLQIFAKFDAVTAVIEDDESALTKIATGDVDLAKAFVEEHGVKAKREAIYEASVALIAAVKRRNERIFGVSVAANRLQRFAAARPSFRSGPFAGVVSMESKRK
jgi:hypothetical protein